MTKNNSYYHMPRAMIDIECLGTGPAGAIIQVAAVAFNLDPAWSVPSYEANVTFEDAMKYGTVDAGAIRFWLKQSDDCRKCLTSPEPQTLKKVLSGLYAWYDENKIKEMWSHATFDSVILDNGYRAIGKRKPWHYKDVRDLRTLFSMAGSSCYNGAPKGTAHRALDDCKLQVFAARSAILRLSDTSD